MSKIVGQLHKNNMWPPECAVPIEPSKAPTTPSLGKSSSKNKLLSSFTRQLTKFLSGIKRRVGRRGHGHGHDRLSQVPSSVVTNSSPQRGTVAFGAPSYGRFSEKLAATFTCNTNSGSSILRAGSDSELPVLRNVYSLSPCVDAPFGTPPGAQSPLRSPLDLQEGFPSCPIPCPVPPQNLPPSHHIFTNTAEDVTSTATKERNSSACGRNSHGQLMPMPEALAPAAVVSGIHGGDAATTAAAAAAAAATTAVVASQGTQFFAVRYDKSNNIFMSSHNISITPSSVIKYPPGDRLPLQPPPMPPQPSALQPLQFLVVNPLSGSGHKTQGTTSVAGTQVAAAAPQADGRWATLETFPAAAAAATTGVATTSINPKLVAAGGSDRSPHLGREPTIIKQHSQQYGVCTTLRSDSPKHQQPLQPHPYAAATRNQLLAEDGTTCIIQSPGRTPPGGSPVGIWLSDSDILQPSPVKVYDKPNAARRLAYQAPELAAANAAAAAAAGRVGAGSTDGSTSATAAAAAAEGRVRGGIQAAEALLGGMACGGGGGGGGRGNSITWLSALQHEGTVLLEDTNVASAVTKDTVAAAAAAAAASVHAMATATSAPPGLRIVTLRSGQLEPIRAIPFKYPSNGCAVQTGNDVTHAVNNAWRVPSADMAISAASSSACRTSPSRFNSQVTNATSPCAAAAAGSSCYSSATSVLRPVAPSAGGAHANGATAETDTCGTRSPCRIEQPPTVPAAPPPPPPRQLQRPQSTSSCHILALNPDMPAAMRRSCWSLDDYNIRRRLYKGSSSAVYKAVCKRSGAPVALKVYFLNQTPAAIVHMIIREIEIHATVAHPNIIMLYAAFQNDRHVVLVLEFASRGDLYGIHMAQENRRMHERQVAELVLAPLLDAVSYLHSLGYCHRDIKPENVLFTSEGRLKIADFGVSIDLSKERAVTRAGTACYMAPEVARCPLKVHPEDNKHDADLSYGTACDIWAIGVLAYELLVGFTPLNAPVPVFVDAAADDNLGAAVTTAAAAAVPALIFPTGISKDSRDFVTMALAVKPNVRPSAQQMRRHPWILGRQLSTPEAVVAAETPVVMMSLPY